MHYLSPDTSLLIKDCLVNVLHHELRALSALKIRKDETRVLKSVQKSVFLDCKQLLRVVGRQSVEHGLHVKVSKSDKSDTQNGFSNETETVGLLKARDYDMFYFVLPFFGPTVEWLW